MRKIYLSFLILLLAGFLISAVQAQKSYKTVKAGVGIDGLRVGKSTRADVIRKYGRNFKTEKYGKYSVQMVYSNGLSFYYCQKDRRQEIFVIEMRSPARVKTVKGIILSKSNIGEVRKKYGKPKKGLRFRGIEFYYVNYNGKDVVSVIDIIENSGMRECRE
ncbi:MAG: hypothetical protein ACR2J3_13505 [Aridibacter sp.]